MEYNIDISFLNLGRTDTDEFIYKHTNYNHLQNRWVSGIFNMDKKKTTISLVPTRIDQDFHDIIIVFIERSITDISEKMNIFYEKLKSKSKIIFILEPVCLAQISKYYYYNHKHKKRLLFIRDIKVGDITKNILELINS